VKKLRAKGLSPDAIQARIRDEKGHPELLEVLRVTEERTESLDLSAAGAPRRNGHATTGAP
jgi:hypothetical protein